MTNATCPTGPISIPTSRVSPERDLPPAFPACPPWCVNHCTETDVDGSTCRSHDGAPVYLSVGSEGFNERLRLLAIAQDLPGIPDPSPAALIGYWSEGPRDGDGAWVDLFNVPIDRSSCLRLAAALLSLAGELK